MRTPNHFALAVVAVAALLVGGVAIAATPGDEITACVHEETGAVRIVDGPCRQIESPLSWNQVGPEGPPGPESLNVVVRQASGTFTLPPGNPDGSMGPIAFCAEGEVAISGGIIGFGVAELEAELAGFGPLFDGGGWFVTWLNPGDEPITISPVVVAMCVQGTHARE